MVMKQSAASINAKQKALLHVAKAALGLTDDEYRAVLYGAAGVESSKDLDHRGFEQVLQRFEDLGFEVKRRWPKGRAHKTDPNALVTPAQSRKLEELYEQLGWARHRQMGFNRRVCGTPWPQTRAEATKVIEAVKKMIARGYSERPRTAGGNGSLRR